MGTVSKREGIPEMMRRAGVIPEEVTTALRNLLWSPPEHTATPHHSPALIFHSESVSKRPIALPWDRHLGGRKVFPQIEMAFLILGVPGTLTMVTFAGLE